MIQLLFFFSGFASLLCEMLWFKQLQLILGSSTQAMSVVVACFFTGLALGSFLGGRLADRARNHLLLYGCLEIAVGLFSFGVISFLSRWESWVPSATPFLSPFLLGAVILVFPTCLMGATLPLLCRYLAKSKDRLAEKVASLYAINTLGGAFGALLGGYLFIDLLGVIHTGYLTSAVYLSVGLLAILLQTTSSSRIGNDSVDEFEDVARQASENKKTSPLMNEATFGAVLALSGFLAIAYEVLWFRLLGFFSYRSVYSLSAILCAYLLGLVIGSLFCKRYLAPHKGKLLHFLALSQVFVAAGVLCSFLTLLQFREVIETTSALLSTWGVPERISLFTRENLSTLLISALVMLPATIALGVAIPLASEIACSSIQRGGRTLGKLYALNTLGGVLGSLLTAFFFLPSLGSTRSFQLFICLNLLLSAFLFQIDRSNNSARGSSLPRTLAQLVLAIFTLIIPGDSLKEALTSFPDAHAVDFREERDATFVVLEYDTPRTGRFQQLLVNKTSYANNRMEGRRYMAPLAHLPVLLHSNPKSALCIAMGTGTTIGSLTLHPELQRIVGVDISKHVFEIAPLFSPLNHDFHLNPKVEKIVEDGRHFLLMNQEKFDVMTFEPPPPTEAGVVNLYSKEFYHLAKQRLNKDGILIQWVPFHVGNEAVARSLIRTMYEEFPHVSLWMPNNIEGLVVGSETAARVDLSRWRERMGEGGLKRAMSEYGFASPEELLATFIAEDKDLWQYVKNDPVITDDRPVIEQFQTMDNSPFKFERLAPSVQPAKSILGTGQVDLQALETAEKAEREIRRYESSMYEIGVDARSRLPHLKEALKLAPNNKYFQYFAAEFPPEDLQ